MTQSHLVGLIAYRGLGFTQLALESILQDPACEVVVIDNKSDEPLHQYLSSPKQRVRVIHNAKNRGCTGALNQILDYGLQGNFEFITIAHNDTLWPARWVETCQKEFHSADIGAVTPLSTNTEEVGHDWVLASVREKTRAFIAACGNLSMSPFWNDPAALHTHAVKQIYPHGVLGVSDYLAAQFPGQYWCKGEGDNSAMTYRRSTLQQIGYFDEIFFPGMGEDSDYNRRMTEAKLHIKRTCAFYVHHWCSLTYAHSQLMDPNAIHSSFVHHAQRKADGIYPGCLRRSCVHNLGAHCAMARLFHAPCPEYEVRNNYY